MLLAVGVVRPIPLGIFTDFFTWLMNFLHDIVTFFSNIFNGFLALFRFANEFYDLLVAPMGYLPSILVAVAVITLLCGLLRCVL